MTLTVHALAGQRDLGVRIVAGDGSAADRPITWVHVSELDDPTPFLSGGELLLTTGLFIRPGVDLDRYVEKLCQAGVLGLGFGVGLSFQEIPESLVSAADRLGLPLLEVPHRTPFIALSRAVSRALAADEYAAVTRTFTAQQELTRAALWPRGPDRVIRLLARKVDGWVALVDGRGGPVALSGDRAAAVLPAIAAEVARLRGHRGSVGAGFEIDLNGGTDTVSLQPVGAADRRRAYLAVGRPGPLSAADRHLVNAAVMLLTLGFEQDAVAPDAVAAVRAAVLELAFAGQMSLARSVASRIGAPFPDDPVVVVVAEVGSVGGSAPGPPVGTAVLGAELDGELVMVVPEPTAATLAAELAQAGRTVGISAAASAVALPDARDQARRAADAAAERGVPVLGFDEIGGSGITGLVDPSRAAVIAESLLAPLVEHDRTGRGDLVASLRAWLAHHGQWDPAAATLGVHRHTLRRRMGLAGRLLGRDLDSPTVRSELWLALQVVTAGVGPGSVEPNWRAERSTARAEAH
jgi:purine catabolism regulator